MANFIKSVFGLNEEGSSNSNSNSNSNSHSQSHSNTSTTSTSSSSQSEAQKVFNLLVIDQQGKENDVWAQRFKKYKEIKTPDSKSLKLVVYQAAWGDICVTGYSRPMGSALSGAHLQAVVDLKQPTQSSASGHTISLNAGSRVKTFRVDFLLIRNQVVGLSPDQNFKNTLMAFKFVNIPSVNSLDSIFNFIERPWVFAELNNIREHLGHSNFPLIEQNYYPTHREMLISPQFPVVVKVGHAHAGYGKVKIKDHHDFADFAGVLGLSKVYSTAEPFIDGDFDLRIQKIGTSYRAIKRIGVSGSWKTNTGSAILEDVELTPKYKLWVDECSKIFGGLDILAVDAIHATSGEELILEVNDTSIGLHPTYEEEDNLLIVDLVIQKIQKHLQEKYQRELSLKRTL